MSDIWYEIASGRNLEQGDIFFACPRYQPNLVNAFPVPENARFRFSECPVDSIVLTHSCDLENGNAQEVLLAACRPWQELYDFLRTSGRNAKEINSFRRRLSRGQIHYLHLLRPYPDEPKLPWSVVDFRELFTLPLEFLQQNAETREENRLRLKSPYKESLSQAYGFYYMRVAYPQGTQDFEKKEPTRKP